MRALVLVSALGLAACGRDDATGASTSDVTGADSGPKPPPPGDAGATPPGSSIGLSCAVGAAIETEPNDDPAHANELGSMLSFCGVLATAADVDYATFTTPAGKKLRSFQAIVHGAVAFDLAVGGATFPPGDPTRYVAGTYLVKAYTREGKPASYEFRVDYE